MQSRARRWSPNLCPESGFVSGTVFWHTLFIVRPVRDDPEYFRREGFPQAPCFRGCLFCVLVRSLLPWHSPLACLLPGICFLRLFLLPHPHPIAAFPFALHVARQAPQTLRVSLLSPLGEPNDGRTRGLQPARQCNSCWCRPLLLDGRGNSPEKPARGARCPEVAPQVSHDGLAAC